MLVQHRVVLEVGEQRRRRRPGVLEQVHGGARHTRRRSAPRLRHRVGHRHLGAAQPGRDEVAAAAPRRHLDHEDDADEQREPAAVGDLRDVGGEERQVDDEQRHGDDAAPSSPTSRQRSTDDPVEQQRGDRHRRRDRDAVGRGEAARRPEAEHQPDAADHQQPVDERHVDLARCARADVWRIVEAREVVELHRLRGEREGAGDQRLRRDHRGHRRQHASGVTAHVGASR